MKTGQSWRGSWYRSWIFWASVLALLGCSYVLAGIYLAPRLIRSQATEWVKVNLGKSIAIGEIKVNPIGFKIDIGDIAIPGPKQPMVAVGHLHLDFSILSIFQDAYRFDAVRIDRPFIDARIRPDGTLNLAELLPRSSSSDKPAPALRIASLSINQGKVAFVDQSRALRPQKTLTPITFTLKDFQTNRAEGGDFVLNARSDRQERFAWRGSLSVAPIASRGRFLVADLRSDTINNFLSEYLPVTPTSGKIAFEGNYSFAYGANGTRFTMAMPKLALAGVAFDGKPGTFRGSASLDTLSASLSDIAFTSDGRGKQEFAAAIPRLAIHGIGVFPTGAAQGGAIRLADLILGRSKLHYGAHRLDLGKLSIGGLDLPIRRERDGQISLATLLPPRAAVATADGAAASSSPPWTVRLDGFALTSAALRIEDRAVTPTARFDIAPINISATGAGTDLSRPMIFQADARINGKASFKAAGTMTPATGAADVKVALANMPLRAAIPYMPEYQALDFRSGDIAATGALRLVGGSKSDVCFKGDASIDNFNVFERTDASALFAWRSFRLTGIDYRPGSVEVARGYLSRPFGRVAILADGNFNYASLVTPGPAAPGDAGLQTAPVAPASTSRQASRPVEQARSISPARPSLPFTLKALSISDGTMSFADYSLQPNFEARIDALSGTIKNVSNLPSGVAAIDLKGHVIDRFSPVVIDGTANLLGYDRKTNIHMAFRNIELPVFNPYSGRYAGYAIAKGKLTTELTYKIDNRALQADHHVIIDQLQWGEATDSKEKVSLPIRLATSLLKDRHGVIDLDVPVTGSLDDPKFRLGPIIWKIIGNLVVKIVTAPFSLIGSLFAGADKAQYVDFAPGSVALPPGAAEGFAALAKGLAERPALQLDIPAGPASAEDAVSMADDRINAAVMAREAKKGESAKPETLDIDEQYDRLKSLYKVRLGKKPVFPDLPVTAADMEAKTASETQSSPKEQKKSSEVQSMRVDLRKGFMPSDAELAALGSARAMAVRDALLRDNNIDPARIFLVTGDRATTINGHARLELKLE